VTEYWEKRAHRFNWNARRRLKKFFGVTIQGQRYERIDILKLIKNKGKNCYKCGCDTNVYPSVIPAPSDALTLDHIIELRDGGLHHYSNIRICCLSCHSSKTAKYNSTDESKSRCRAMNLINNQRRA